MLRRLHRVLGLLAVLPLALLAVSAPLYGMQCLMSGQVLGKCCCPTVAPAEDGAPAEARIASASCCRLHKVDVVQPASEQPAPRVLLAPPASLADGPALAGDPTPDVPRVRSTQAAPATGPPILLLKRSFLI